MICVFRDNRDDVVSQHPLLPLSSEYQNEPISSLCRVTDQCRRARLTAGLLGVGLSLLSLPAAFLAFLFNAQFFNRSLLSLHQAFSRTNIESLPVVFENLLSEEDFRHSAQFLCVSAQNPFEVVDFDLLAARVGCADCGAVAGFDDEVCDYLVEGCEGGWKWLCVAECFEEASNYSEVVSSGLVRVHMEETHVLGWRTVGPFVAGACVVRPLWEVDVLLIRTDYAGRRCVVEIGFCTTTDKDLVSSCIHTSPECERIKTQGDMLEAQSTTDVCLRGVREQGRMLPRALASIQLATSWSALFNFQSLLLVILLFICTCSYTHGVFPAIMDKHKDGFTSVFWRAARIGERLSPYISVCCVVMAVSITETIIYHTPLTSNRVESSSDNKSAFSRRRGVWSFAAIGTVGSGGLPWTL
ncbi:hypothetical protein KCU83_g349, partial [Aureobasidium melanogenum]